MVVTTKNTVFIVGDSQVGKTTIARNLFKNRELVLKPSVEGTTEHEVAIPGRLHPVKVLEIRNPAILANPDLEYNRELDCMIFCYAIDNPESYEHITDTWIPLFEEHMTESMVMLVIGNKKDLRKNNRVKRSLAQRRLKPVPKSVGTDLLRVYPAIDTFFECTANDPRSLELISKIIQDTVLNHYSS